MIEHPVAVITGASSGIGKETALAYSRKGYAVVLAARREEKLNEVADEVRRLSPLDNTDATMPIPTDVSHPADVPALVGQTMDRFGRIDVMVNNAGYGQFGRIWEISDQAMREIFEVNFYGAFHGCKAVAPIMIEQGRGHIFNVSSVIGRTGSPFHGAYSATKFALSGLTESLRIELHPHGVRVTEVCPALTETEFFENVRDGEPRSRSDFFRLKRKMPARKVAGRIVARTGKNTPRMVFTMGGKMLILLATVWPKMADRVMNVYYNDLLRSLEK
jgi:short-subunit dehydrogenase